MPKKITSIKESDAEKFAKSAEVRDRLNCDMNTGFHLFKTANGASWRYRYWDDDGKRRVATIGKFPAVGPAQAAETARRWRDDDADPLAEKKTAKAQRQQARRDAEARTLESYLDGAYKRHQDRKKSGDETLKRIKHAFPEFLDRDMATLRPGDIHDWQIRRESEGRAHATLQRDFGALRTLLRHATRQDPPVLDENPLAKVTLERPEDNARTRQLEDKRNEARRLLTNDEIQGLYVGLDTFAEQCRQKRRNSRAHGKPHLPSLDDVAQPHWFVPFAYCALYTGLRPGDLYTLTWQELNVPFGRLVKTPEKTRHHPEPAKVTMTLPDQLREVMQDWWDQAGQPAQGLVFPSPVAKTHGAQMDKKAHRGPWNKVKELGELPAGLSFYSLRHHFISALVAGGVPLFTVARLAGHKSVAMIEKNYGHLCPDAAADAMAVFAASVQRKEQDSAEAGAG
ncbi:integrase family protein [Salinisphaera hydrothermalis]|uniref:integrase family protein n=1 Tax=Salinisphaera hydrothermalis TaxID=563188 RepID=UPI00333E5EAF